MIMKRFFFLAGAMLITRTVAFAVDSGFQDYSSGYYTKGLDTAANFDSGSEVYDPYYVPARDWAIVPRLTITVTWDDNLLLTNDDPQRAELIDIIPGVLAIYGRPENNYLYLDAGTIFHAYDSSDQLSDQSNYMLTLGGVYRTGKSTINGGAGFRRTETADTVIGQRIVKSDYVLNAGFNHEFSEKTSAGVDLGAEFNNYDDDDLNDYQQQDVSLRLARKVTEASDVYGRLGFGNDDVDAEGDAGDASYMQADVGFSGKQSAKVTLSGALGYQWRTMADDAAEDVEHWTSSLGVNANPFGFTIFFANVDVSVTPAINSLGQTTIDQRYTLGVNRRLFTDRLRGNASGFWGVYDYEGVPLGDSTANLNRSDDYLGYNLGLDYYTIHNLSIGLTFSYFENQGNQNVSEQDRERTAYDSGRWVLRASWNY